MARHPEPSGSTVTTRLGPLNVRVTGDGPPALLWHSLFVDSTTWTRLEQPLTAERRLILIDGPCHGTNPRITQPFGLHDCVGVASDVLDHFGVDRPVDWLGNAWGGHVGILFAAAHPDRCRSLIAIGAPVHSLSRADRRQTVLLAAVYRAAGPRVVVKPLVDALLGPRARTEDPEGAAIVADAFSRADRRNMYNAVRWLSLRRPDLTPVLDRLDTPTLLTTGVDDPMWTLPNASAAATHLAHGALATLPAAGHIGPLLQHTPTTAELITTFWRDPERTVASHRGTTTSPT
ncbi:alpha/beta fold hydrolase [Kribbella speibonae]|uniref:Alpha/beta hydrolase n=1 Tax=Kribbella speibonae TaxID=1572660 RepID=A0A4R0IR36_9ACTN|nr:alpha/beta hydrolase [Kribbella speibonae]TCC36243.1 alpha/beta hydrolase [Kribbella speibonae]